MVQERGETPQSGQSIDQDLYQVAKAILVETGIAGLSLRPLAAGLGVSTPTLTNRFGPRGAIVATIVHMARMEDLTRRERWQRQFVTTQRLSPVIAADLMEAILEEQGSEYLNLSIVFLEFFQASAWDPELRRLLVPWLDDRARFWAQLGALAGIPNAMLATNFLAGYELDELAYTVAIGRMGPYRMLRKLCLNRLFRGLVASEDLAGDASLFDSAFAALEYSPASLSVLHGAPVANDWRTDVARAAAKLLTSRGVGAVTHRAVGELAQVKPTTLAYRFPTHDDLVLGGLEYAISNLISGVADGRIRPGDAGGGEEPGIDIGRATQVIALAAIRRPELRPCAADMRRRRGINLLKILRDRCTQPDRLDFLAAQSLSVALIGLSNALPIYEAVDSGLAPRTITIAMDWMEEKLRVSDSVVRL